MTAPLTLTRSRRPDGVETLAVVGEIDMDNAAELAAAITAALADGGPPLVLDLTGVEYLDSAGLSVLLEHAPGLEVVANPLLAPVLTISGLPGLTTVRGLGGADS